MNQITGDFAWTNDTFGCGNINITDECSNPGPFINHIINFCAMIVFYAAYIVNLKKIARDVKLFLRKQNYQRINVQVSPAELESFNEVVRSIWKILFLLTVAYLAFLLPITIFETCSPAGGLFQSTTIRSIIASW